MKSKKKTLQNHNKTIKKSSNNKILEPFEKDFENELKPSLIKANHLRNSHLKKLFYDLNYNIKPQNDFYNYVDSIWYKNIKLNIDQAYIVEIDDFRLVQYKIYNQLNEIIKQFIKTNNNKISTSLKNYYQSTLNLNSTKICMEYAKKEMAIIDNYLNNSKSVWPLLGYLNRNEMFSLHCPFTWKVSQDQKNVNKMQSYISSPTFSLPDTSVYFDDGTKEEYKKKYKNYFYQYVNKTFINCFGNNHGFNPKDIFDVEQQLIVTFVCDNIKEPIDSYSKIYKEEALTKYKFDWEQLSKCIGFNKTPDFFISNNLSYLSCATKILLDNWNSSKWRTYWIFIYIRQLTRFSQKGKDYYGNFYANVVTGEKDIIDTTLGGVILTSYAFNSLITKEYVKEYAIPENIEYTKILCDELKLVFTRIIKRSNWLQPKTRDYALLKLKHFKFYIGETGKLLPDPILNYLNNDIWNNLLLLSASRLKQFININNETPVNIPTLVWSSTPLSFLNLEQYIVNASYTPSKNAITIPIAYMQKPFLDLHTTHSFQYNLAHIGFTIGHEMSHALDDWGSKYDYNGNLYDWWTIKDKNKYKIIQKSIINQYEEWAKRDGIKYDASKTIGEDLADISGITTVIEYLFDYMAKEKEFPTIIENSMKTFFTFYAYQMRQRVPKKAMQFQLLTNPHPPNKYRTNIPLSRTPSFREIYNISPKDKMYWNSTNRVWQN
jgi:predicted metalloendopeptidase